MATIMILLKKLHLTYFFDNEKKNCLFKLKAFDITMSTYIS